MLGSLPDPTCSLSTVAAAWKPCWRSALAAIAGRRSACLSSTHPWPVAPAETPTRERLRLQSDSCFPSSPPILVLCPAPHRHCPRPAATAPAPSPPVASSTSTASARSPRSSTCVRGRPLASSGATFSQGRTETTSCAPPRRAEPRIFLSPGISPFRRSVSPCGVLLPVLLAARKTSSPGAPSLPSSHPKTPPFCPHRTPSRTSAGSASKASRPPPSAAARRGPTTFLSRPFPTPPHRHPHTPHSIHLTRPPAPPPWRARRPSGATSSSRTSPSGTCPANTSGPTTRRVPRRPRPPSAPSLSSPPPFLFARASVAASRAFRPSPRRSLSRPAIPPTRTGPADRPPTPPTPPLSPTPSTPPPFEPRSNRTRRCSTSSSAARLTSGWSARTCWRGSPPRSRSPRGRSSAFLHPPCTRIAPGLHPARTCTPGETLPRAWFLLVSLLAPPPLGPPERKPLFSTDDDALLAPGPRNS